MNKAPVETGADLRLLYWLEETSFGWLSMVLVFITLPRECECLQ